MKREACLRLNEAEPKVVVGDGQNIGRSLRICDCSRRKKSFKAGIEIAVGLMCVLLLAVAARFSDLDSDYATSVRMTAAIRQALGFPASAEAASGATGRGVILVAEKDDSQRLIAKTTLERYGYTVMLADSGSQTVALLRKNAPRVGLVLLDRAALRNASQDVLRQIKTIRPDVRILVSQPTGAQLPTGASGAIAEPLAAPPLAEAVRKVLASN